MNSLFRFSSSVHKFICFVSIPFAMAVCGWGMPGTAKAEVNEVRLSVQYGIPYLPLIIMKRKGIVEQELKKAGLGLTKVTWRQFSGSGAMNDALFSNNLDFISGGPTDLIMLWSKTGGKVKSIGAWDAIENYLVSNNPQIHSVLDLKAQDRIAVPGVKITPHAIVLQMAAEKYFGDYKRLDPLLVPMKHPDATTALLTSSAGIDCHSSVPPYYFMELANSRIHKVMSFSEILGGRTSLMTVSTTTNFYDRNPKTARAVIAAFKTAAGFIGQHPEEAARIYLAETHDKVAPAALIKLLRDPSVGTVAPYNVMKFAKFMHKVGDVKTIPSNWQTYFFPELHGLQGS